MPKKKKPKAPPPHTDPGCCVWCGHKPNKEKTQCLCGMFKIGETSKVPNYMLDTQGFKKK